jgi:hypothetical protein
MRRKQPESQPLVRPQLEQVQLLPAPGFQQPVPQPQLPVPERQQVLEVQPAQLPELLGHQNYLHLHR